MDKTQVLDKAISLANKVNNKLTYTLEKQKQKLANKVFDNNKYVQEFIANFDNEYEYTYFDESGFGTLIILLPLIFP